MKTRTLENKRSLKHLYTQYSLKWSLKVGKQLKTLNLVKAIRLANVKPSIFRRWVSGTLAAPANILDKIKSEAFASSRRKHRKQLNQHKNPQINEESMIASLQWKHMIFDELRIAAKRRFCFKLKKLYR